MGRGVEAKFPDVVPGRGDSGATHPLPTLARLGRGLEAPHSARLSPPSEEDVFSFKRLHARGRGLCFCYWREKFERRKGKSLPTTPPLAALSETCVPGVGPRGEVEMEDLEPLRLIWGKKGPQTQAASAGRASERRWSQELAKPCLWKKWASHFVRVFFLPEVSARGPHSQPPQHS